MKIVIPKDLELVNLGAVFLQIAEDRCPASTVPPEDGSEWDSWEQADFSGLLRNTLRGQLSSAAHRAITSGMLVPRDNYGVWIPDAEHERCDNIFVKRSEFIAFAREALTATVSDTDGSKVDIQECRNPPGDSTAPATRTLQSGVMKRERQIQAIELAAQAFDYAHMNIPRGGKVKLMKYCKETWPELFGSGDDPFIAAWSVGIKENRIRTEDHSKYSRR